VTAAVEVYFGASYFVNQTLPGAAPFGFKGAGDDSVLSALPFEHFSTPHSNDTNKVIDTQGTFCHTFPCLLTPSLEAPSTTQLPLT
jgi:hypothetical protein